MLGVTSLQQPGREAELLIHGGQQGGWGPWASCYPAPSQLRITALERMWGGGGGVHPSKASGPGWGLCHER